MNKIYLLVIAISLLFDKQVMAQNASNPCNVYYDYYSIGSKSQSVCINTQIAPIYFGAIDTPVVFGLPNGVTGNYDGFAQYLTISGAPTASPGLYVYKVYCKHLPFVVEDSGTITVKPNNTINLTSAVGTNAQTICISSAISNITYATTGATIVIFSGLPSGVTGIWASGVATISGTPTAPGTSNYTVTLTGGCGNVLATGTITAISSNSINLISASGTNTQTACISTAIDTIRYTTVGATGVTFSGLPSGVTGIWASGVATISGTPAVSGPFNYTVTLTGGCGNTLTTAGTITVKPSNAITLTSAIGTNAQSPCINTAIDTIKYTTIGATGATFLGLPSGVTGSWTAGVATISGTPTVSGTFNYTVTLTGGCGNIIAAGTITVKPNGTLNLVSGAPSQNVCINASITAIIYSVGGSATGNTVTGLPNGISANYTNGVIIISGAPSAPGIFHYIVYTSGPCANPIDSGVITVKSNNTIALTSAPTTAVQTVCINTSVTNINYATTGATGATFSGLPSGVTGLWAPSVVTISGTPIASGTFNYTVTLTGGCGNITASGTIIVKPNNTISLVSTSGTNAQTVCINTAIAPITYATTGATGAAFSGLPSGVTPNWSNNVVTVSGAPTASGTFNYTITLTGGCGNVAVPGAITVNPNNTIALSSAPTTAAQTVCINTAIAPITYATTGATGATFSGLPSGVTGLWAPGVVTISGTPTASGTFNYTVTLTGGCGNITATGTITVITSNVITLVSTAGTNAQSPCINTVIDTIKYTTIGATGATFFGLPRGDTGSWASGIVTISGTPDTAGTFNYTITLTGGCGNITASGTIIVKPNNTISLVSTSGTNAQTVCINTAIAPITYATTGATGAAFSGLPSGVTPNWSNNVVTVSGAPTASGTFNYTITLTGGCGNVAVPGTITVKPNNTIALSSAQATSAQTVCINTAIDTIKYVTTGATGATFSGLPPGVDSTWVSNTVTISGTPIVSGTYTYIVTDSGCGNISRTGTIIVRPDATLKRVSGDSFQTVCINMPIANIVYSVGGSDTGGYVSGLPAGDTGIFTSGVIIISGTPSVAGVFHYVVHTKGPCANPIDSGIITVKSDNIIVLTSDSTTIKQNRCINTAIDTIKYATKGARDATFFGLPAGVKGTWKDSMVTISGTPIVSGFFNYTVTDIGGCGTATNTGTINVTPNNIEKPEFIWQNLHNDTLCRGSEYLDFKIKTPVAGLSYLWSSVPDASITDTNHANTLISFPNIGTYSIKVKAIGDYCTASDSQIVIVNSTLGINKRAIFLKQPGNILIYPDNSMNAGNGYQWGYDSLLSSSPFRRYSAPDSIQGQIYQYFIPEGRLLNSNNELDTIKRAFWVVLRQGSCFTRVYYNGPYAAGRAVWAPHEDNTVRLNVIPSPNNGSFNISLEGNIYGNMRAVVYNTLGQAVFDVGFTKAIPVFVKQINIGDLASGPYYMEIRSSDLKKVQTSFVIQH